MNCDGELFINFSSWTNNASILWTFHELFMNVHEQFIKSWTTFHRGRGGCRNPVRRGDRGPRVDRMWVLSLGEPYPGRECLLGRTICVYWIYVLYMRLKCQLSGDVLHLWLCVILLWLYYISGLSANSQEMFSTCDCVWYYCDCIIYPA